MKAVVTRCLSAEVTVAGVTVGKLPSPGLLVLLGVTHTDTQETADKLLAKLINLRILDDEQSALDLGAPVLIVSQFTLYGSVRKGRRPSWSNASGRDHAEPLIEYVAEQVAANGLHVETGSFGEMMQITSVNDGPFTILIDTADLA